MQFGILGPVEVRADGKLIRIGGAKQRALLAILLLHANRAVTTDRLIELLWGDAAGESALNTLQVHIAQLRRVLEPHRKSGDPASLLLSRPSGYLLTTEAHQLDLEGFEQLVGEGRLALTAGDADSAARDLHAALALWRGPALANIADEPFVLGERTRLDELRLAALEDRIEADLALGRHAELVSELKPLVAEHPTRERLHGQLMLALYRGGRQADASAAYHRLRETLVDERGMEPSAPVQKLFREILDQDPTLDLPSRTQPEVRPGSGNTLHFGQKQTPAPAGGFLGAAPERALVGREAELGQLLGALQIAATGLGQLVLLVGEAGIGKTRLAQEVMLRAQERGFRVLVGWCYQQRASAPLFPFVEALATAVALAPEEVVKKAASRWPDLGRLTPSAATPDIGSDDAGGLQRVLNAVTGFFQLLAADAPLAVLLDDLHWADSASIELLQHLARHLHGDRVLLLGTYRNAEVDRQHPLETALGDLTREHLVAELEVRRMTPDGTAALVHSHLAVQEASVELLNFVHERTEGNPFFIEELLKAMIEQRVIHEKDGDWQRTEVGDIQLPHSVRSVVGQRVGRLGPGAQDMLHVASVLGHEFDLELLLATAMQPEPVLLDHLDTALAAQLIEERRDGSRERFGFVHALIQQALYDEQRAHRRRRIHLRAGEALERVQTARTEVSDELARHFLAAGETARSIRYSILAGDRASAMYAHAEAARHYRIALNLLVADDEELQRAEVRCKLASELNDLDRPDDAIALYQAALASYERVADPVLQARVHRGIAWVHQIRFDLTRALPHLDAALRLWPAEHADREFTLLLLDAARAQLFARNTTAAANLAERGLALANRLGDPALEARALLETAVVQWHGVDAAAVIRLLDRAEVLGLRARDWPTLQRVYANRSGLRYRHGDLEGVWTDSRRAVEIAERMGAPERIAGALLNYVENCYLRGMWQEGREAARKAPTAGRFYRLLMAVMEGDPERALSLVDTLSADARRRDDRQTQIYILWHQSNIALDLGRNMEAAAAARQVADLDPTRQLVGWSAWAYGPFAEATARLKTEDAAAILTEADAVSATYQLRSMQPQLRRARGILFWHRGDLDAAISVLQSSANTARSQHAVLELGRTLAVLADVARARDDAGLAANADKERASIVQGIGPEVRGLVWAGASVTPAAGF